MPAAYEAEAERWWDILYPAQALANGQWWLMANQCGANATVRFLGGSQVIAPDGRVVAAAPRLATSSSHVDYLVVDIELASSLRQARDETGLLIADRRPALYRLG
jgi:predicted amidohydrolase